MTARFTTLNDLMAPYPSGARFCGTIVVGAAGAVASTKGKGFTATKLATAGQYEVTLTRPINSFIGATCSVLPVSGAASPTRAHPISYDVPTHKFVVQVVNGSDAAANPADGDEVYFDAMVTLRQAG